MKGSGSQPPRGGAGDSPSSPGDGTAELYALLAEHARDAILFVRRDDGRILEANRAAAELYGWTREELRELRVADLRAPETLPGVDAQMAEADARGVRFDTLHRRKGGDPFPVEVSSSGVTVGGERILVSVVRDATERRAMEVALRESEDRLALGLEAAGLGIFYAVPYGPMQLSARCREILGAGDSPFADFEAYLKVVHPADRDGVREDAARWLDPAGDGHYKGQYRLLRPDGSIRWVAASGIVRYAKVAGALLPVRLVGTLFDITDQKLAQEQLMLNDRLASVGMLAAGIAHEINNPLSFLWGALEFLAERTGTPGAAGGRVEEAQALAEAREGAMRVRQVVRDLRTLSGAREERRVRLELRAIVESAARMAAGEIRQRARLEQALGAAPAVMADEARLGQVVVNLLVNAAHAIPDGRPLDHEVRVVLGTDPAGRALLEVQDTGAGIPPALADRIFEPFFTTKASGKGTGLGLAICRSTVEALGGEISAHARPGGGTTMRVLLPAAPPLAEASPAPAAAARGEGRRGRVLVVDDEPAVGLSIRRLLEPEHEVHLRTRAEDALDAIERGERFDAILCDLGLSGMSGPEFHAALEGAAPEQARRVIVLTSGSYGAAARAFMERSALPRIDKPFDAAELRERLRAVIGAG